MRVREKSGNHDYDIILTILTKSDNLCEICAKKTKSLDKNPGQRYPCIGKNTLLIDSSYFLERIGSTNKEKTINIVRNKQTNVHGV